MQHFASIESFWVGAFGMGRKNFSKKKKKNFKKIQNTERKKKKSLNQISSMHLIIYIDMVTLTISKRSHLV